MQSEGRLELGARHSALSQGREESSSIAESRTLAGQKAMPTSMIRAGVTDAIVAPHY